MRERPILFSAPMVRAVLDGTKTQTRRFVKGTFAVDCPYGFVGDRLWVREAWRLPVGLDRFAGGDPDAGCRVFYEADDVGENARHGAGRFRHARFMPRWASRITLEITDVRCQRLQSISEEDARAEGALHQAVLELVGRAPSDGVTDARRAFFRLWDTIHGTGQNDAWVWALTFKRVDEVRRA